MEKKINKIYSEAYEGISKSWNAFMDSHYPLLKNAQLKLEEAKKSGDREAIKEAQDTYERTAKNITVNNRRYQSMVNETTEKLAHTNEVALDYVNDNLPKVYTMNYNALGDQDLKGYNFSLTNENAVKNLAKRDSTFLPTKQLDKVKDKRWNEKQINSQVMQGILQGESIPKIAKRMENVIKMNDKSAIRNARTMVTAAENKGRQDSFVKAQDDGVIMEREWVATADDRTREWHAALDGTVTYVDVPWETEYGEIMYPGDPDADPADVYNCRCSMVAHVVGYSWSDNETEDEEVEEVTTTEEAVEEVSVEESNEELHGDEEAYRYVHDACEASHIAHNSVEMMSESLTEQEIIDKLAGGDKTKGSCASLALSYCANKQDIDATDFRGGNSQMLFSRGINIERMFKSANANIETHELEREVKEAANIIRNIKQDKEYYLVTGRHASIIRNSSENGLEYLELQSNLTNGWRPFEREGITTSFGSTATTVEDTLYQRFGCRKTIDKNSYTGDVRKKKLTLVEVDSFQATEEFKDLMGYINTSVNEQKKGLGGGIK